MLKKTITYEDYNGIELTEDFYFNLSKVELVDLGLAEDGGLVGAIQRIIQTEDKGGLIKIFKDFILLSYGIKSEDGRRFIKSEALRNEFTQTEAYSVLFIELAENSEAAMEFINGILPASLQDEIAKSDDELVQKLKDPTNMTKEELLELLSKKTQ